jgi:hypothetical protein
VAAVIQELLFDNGFAVHYIDQIPPYDQVKYLTGFVAWDIDESNPMHSTEGVEYANGEITLNFQLAVTVYASALSTRNSIEKLVLDELQPIVSGRRLPLRQVQKQNAFVRHIVWLNVSEFPIPKTGQSNAEMSASVLMFNCSISVSE